MIHEPLPCTVNACACMSACFVSGPNQICRNVTKADVIELSCIFRTTHPDTFPEFDCSSTLHASCKALRLQASKICFAWWIQNLLERQHATCVRCIGRVDHAEKRDVGSDQLVWTDVTRCSSCALSPPAGQSQRSVDSVHVTQICTSKSVGTHPFSVCGGPRCVPRSYKLQWLTVINAGIHRESTHTLCKDFKSNGSIHSQCQVQVALPNRRKKRNPGKRPEPTFSLTWVRVQHTTLVSSETR